MSKSIGVLTLDLVARTVEYDRNLQRSENQTKTSGNAMVTQLQRVEVQSKNTGETFVAMGNKVKAAAAAFAVANLVNYADGYTQMAARVKNATSSLSEYQMVQDHLYQTAQGTFRNLAEAQEVFLASFDGLKQAGYNTQQVLAITDSLSYSYVHNAASADKAAAATAAYGKVMDKNKVEADAWYSLIAAAPNLINDIAKASGKSATEIRELGASGKISAEQLNEGLMKSRDANQALADSMSNSLADGARVAANAIQKYTGELNMQYGVTAKAAEVFGVFAENIDVVAKTGVVLAAFWAGTYIPGIVAGTAATVQDTVSKAANILAQRAKVQADYDVAKSNLAATAAMVKAMGVTNAQTAAMMSNARAAYQQAAASRASVLASGSLVSVMGGPVGLGVAVASVAAGYLLMSNNAKDNTQSLRENNESVDDAIAKYRELNSVQQAGQLAEEREKLSELESEYKKVNDALKVYTSGMATSNDFVTESQLALAELSKEYSNGKMTLEQFTDKVQQSGKISQTTKDHVSKMARSVYDAGDAAKTQKQFIDNISTSIKNTGDQAKQAKAEITGMSKELSKLLADNKTEAYKNDFIAAGVKAWNLDAKHVEMIYAAREAAGILGTTKKLEEGILTQISERFKSEQRLNAVLDERNKKLKAESDQLSVNAKVRANAEKYNFAKYEQQNGLPMGALSAIHMIESRGNARAYNKESGAAGGFQFLPATAKQYGVKDRYDVEESAQGAAKYLKYLLKLFDGNLEKAVRSYHAGEGNVQRGTNIGKHNNQYWKDFKGYMGGSTESSVSEWQKQANDFLKIQEEQAEARKQIELDVANEVTRIKSELTDKIGEIEKANFGPARQKELIAEYTARAENEIAVASQALQSKLDDFDSYLLTEEQLIKQSYARRQFDVQHDVSLTKAQREKASESLRKQMVNELELNRIAEEKDLLQIQQKWLSSGEYAQRYYQLVRDEIEATAGYSPTQKAFLLKEANFDYDEKRKGVGENYQRATGDDVDTFASERLKSDQDAIIEAYEWELITQDEYREQMLASEQRYYNAKAQLGLESMAGMMGGWSDVFKTVLGETSGFYHAAFAMERAFAVAKATMNAPLVYTQTYAALSGIPLIGPYIAQPAAIAAAGLQIAQAATAGSVAFATGGLVRGPGTGTSDSINARLSDYEYVVKAASVQKIGASNLDYINKTGELPPRTDALQPKIGGSNMTSVQQSVSPVVNVNPNLVIVDDRESAKDALYGPDGEKAFLYHYKRNKSKLGA